MSILKNTAISVRLMVPNDLTSIEGISQSIHEDNAVTYEELLAFHLDEERHGHAGFVATFRGHVQGYVTFAQAGKAALIHLIGMAAPWQRRGVGRMLVDALKKRVGKGTVEVVVPEHWVDLQIFLKRCGFRCRGGTEYGVLPEEGVLNFLWKGY
jgi:GNAT superfamily N-acetyltransferase